MLVAFKKQLRPDVLTVGPVPGEREDVQVVVWYLMVVKAVQLLLLPFLEPKVCAIIPKADEISIWIVVKVLLLVRQFK